MDNDLMARRLRPPSEPIHESSASDHAAVEPQAGMPPKLAAPEQPAVTELPEVPWEFSAPEDTAAPWDAPADEPAPMASGEDAAWADAFDSADGAPSVESAASEEAVAATGEATPAQQQDPWLEAQAAQDEAPWAETAQDEAPWAQTVQQQAPWVESAQDEAPWAQTVQQQAPWVESAQDEAPWAESPDDETPWDHPSEAAPGTDAFAPDRPAWDQPNDDLWSPAIEAGAPADPDDAMAPVLDDVAQQPVSAATVESSDVEQPDQPDWPAADLLVPQPDEDFAAAAQQVPDAVAADEPAEYQRESDWFGYAAWATADSAWVARDAEPAPDEEAVAEVTSADAEVTSGVAEDAGTEAEVSSAVADDGDDEGQDESLAAADYDPTAAFDPFAGAPATEEMDAAEAESASAPTAQEPAAAPAGPTPPAELFAFPDQPHDEPPAEQFELPTPAPALVPMVTTASAMTTPGNPANLVVRIEVALVEDSERLHEPTEYLITPRHPAFEPRAQREPGAEDGQQAQVGVEATGWTEPGMAAGDTADEWTGVVPAAGGVAWNAPTPSEAYTQQDPLSHVPAAAITPTAQPAHPMQPAAMSARPVGQAGETPDLWFLSSEPKPAAAGEAEAGARPAPSVMSGALTVAMAVLVVVLVLVFIQLMTSILH